MLPGPGTTQHVDVQMRDFLTAVAAGVDNYSETVFAPELEGELAREI